MTRKKILWEPIDNDFKVYLISSTGLLKTMPSGLLKKPHLSMGYFRVCIHSKPKRKNILLHRLVAKAFIPNPKNLPCINHKNGIKTDNRVENLEWCTHKENTRHSIIILNRKFTPKRAVKCITLNKIYSSAQEASIHLGIRHQYIYMACSGYVTHIRGLKFKYLSKRVKAKKKKIIPLLKRKNLRWVQYKGIKKTLSDWARYLNTSDSNLHHYIKRNSFHKAFLHFK